MLHPELAEQRAAETKALQYTCAPQAAQAIASGEARKEFAFYAVGVDDADMDQLRQLAVRDPLISNG